MHGEKDWQQVGIPQNLGSPISTKNISSIAFSLKIHGPLYARYKNINDSSDGHLVVITGIDLNSGRIYTNNPWGIYGDQTYDEFKSGFAGSENNSYILDRIYIMD